MSRTKKEEVTVQTASEQTASALPLPTHEAKRLVQAEVKQDLFDAVEKEAKKRGLKIRQVVEWGLQAFLTKSKSKHKD